MKKRILSIILAFSLIFSIAAATSVTVSAGEYNGDLSQNSVFFEMLDDGTYEIIGYNGEEETLEFPNMYDGKAVTSIGESVFCNGNRIKSVTIPDSITNINPNAFEYCFSLAEINVSPDNNSYASQNGVLFNKDKTELVAYPIGVLAESYTIPDGVTTIGDYAFRGSESLKSVIIPTSVTTVGEYAFDSCVDLESITIPDSVTAINCGAFEACTSLTGITIPGSVSEIGKRAFQNCLYLKSVTIEDGVKYIGDFAFNGCYAVSDLTIPSSVITIGSYAFCDCDLITSIAIPDGVTTIGNGAFGYCDSLTTVTIPESVSKIEICVFTYCGSLESINVSADSKYFSSQDGVLFNKDKTKLICFPTKNTIVDYTIPDSVKLIGTFAFSYCEMLTSVVIPDGVTKIYESAFEYCTSLASVTIPKSMTDIKYDAFTNCTSLKSITIPDSVTNIDDYAVGYYYEYGDILKVPDFRIYCYADSAAEQYAIGNEIDYTLLNESVDTPSVTVTQPTAGSITKTENGDGTITLTVDANQFAEFANWNIDGDYEIVEGSLYSETITIRPIADGIKISAEFNLTATGIYGDVNFDGKVNMLDVLLIRKYIAKQPIDLDENLADVTCDSKVNMLDALLIRKYIAKQPVTLGPKG